VTRWPALRPLLRRLVAPEFPDLMVLAVEELVSFDGPARE
jgi:flagellar biosynthesis component FlhA